MSGPLHDVLAQNACNRLHRDHDDAASLVRRAVIAFSRKLHRRAQFYPNWLAVRNVTRRLLDLVTPDPSHIDPPPHITYRAASAAAKYLSTHSLKASYMDRNKGLILIE